MCRRESLCESTEWAPAESASLRQFLHICRAHSSHVGLIDHMAWSEEGGVMSSQRKHKSTARSRHAIVTRSLRTAASALVILTLSASVFGASPARAGASTQRAMLSSCQGGVVSAASVARRSHPAPPPAHRGRWLHASSLRSPLSEQPTHLSTAAVTDSELAAPAVVTSATSTSASSALLHFSSKASRTRGHPVQG